MAQKLDGYPGKFYQMLKEKSSLIIHKRLQKIDRERTHSSSSYGKDIKRKKNYPLNISYD